MHATFRVLLASLAVGAASSAGAPLVCFPIDVGDAADAASLPWNDRGGALAPMAADRLPSVLQNVLAVSDDALLHMEALRRAALFSQQSGAKQDPWESLVRKLERAALAAAARPDGAPEPETGPERSAARSARAFAWFDLGYALSVGREIGHEPDGDPVAYLRKAIELRPDDRALRFGVALAFFDASFRARDERDPSPLEREAFVQLERALDGGDERLRRVALSTFGCFLGCGSDGALAEKIRAKLASKA